MRADLLEAYRNADYVVFGEPDLVLRIGVPSEYLDALLDTDGAASAAFVTGANPHGLLVAEQANQIASFTLAEMLDGAGYTLYEGEGRDPAGEWRAEASLLIVGIARAEAEALGRRMKQNAIVFAEKGRAPELVVLA